MTLLEERQPAARATRAPQRCAFVDAPDWDALAPRGLYARYGKRLLDFALLLAVSPLALLLGALIAPVNALVFGDPRRVFFTQERVGHRGRVFRIVKFRTMKEPKRSAHDSWSSGEDRLRVTAFGRFLRNAHLDELPQLINIARGDMGFIGPRPEMRSVEEWACERIPGFSARLAVRPGITGWAQITQGYTGRDVGEYTTKLAINEHYRRNLTLRMDLEIVLRTAVWMLRGKGWEWRGPTVPTPVPEPRLVEASAAE